MSDYVITNGELRHYGVPGMKWGVRKSRAERERDYVKKWRKREVAKISKRAMKNLESGARKVDRKARKYEEVFNREGGQSPKTYKAAGKYANTKYQVVYKDEVWKAEAKKVMKMSYSDIKAEQVTVGKKYIESALITAAGIGATALGAPVGIISVPNTANIKTNSRVSEEDRKKAQAAAYVEAAVDLYGLPIRK